MLILTLFIFVLDIPSANDNKISSAIFVAGVVAFVVIAIAIIVYIKKKDSKKLEELKVNEKKTTVNVGKTADGGKVSKKVSGGKTAGKSQKAAKKSGKSSSAKRKGKGGKSGQSSKKSKKYLQKSQKSKEASGKSGSCTSAPAVKSTLPKIKAKS